LHRDHGASAIKVLLGNDPRSYRETLRAVFERLRPNMEFLAVEPGDLDRELSRLHPGIVVCSYLTETVENQSPAWVELHPGGGPHAVVGMEGELVTYPCVNLELLLSIVDRAGRSRV
jgi:hypothetical protein